MTAVGSRILAASLLLLAGITSLNACSDRDDDLSSFCAAVSAAPSLDSIIRGFTAQDPVVLTRNLDEAQAAYGRIRDAAPDEIRDEAEALVAVVDIVVDAVRANPDDRQTAIDDVRSSLVDQTSIDGDTEAVTDMVAEHCGIDLNAGLIEGADDEPNPPSPSTEAE